MAFLKQRSAPIPRRRAPAAPGFFLALVLWAWLGGAEARGQTRDVEIKAAFLYHFTQFVELVHPEDRPALDHMVATSLQKKSNLAVDFRVKLPNGSTRYISSRGRAMEDSSGAGMGMGGRRGGSRSMWSILLLRPTSRKF